MCGEDNIYVCSRCSYQFKFYPQTANGEEAVKTVVTCPRCSTGYVRKVFTFPTGYSSKPHS